MSVASKLDAFGEKLKTLIGCTLAVIVASWPPATDIWPARKVFPVSASLM
jgi:hypothetical protein